MALTRKLLTALGIDADKIEQIIEAHTETVDALKKQRDEYKAEAEKLPDIQKELDTLKKTVEDDPNKAYKQQYDDLKKEYDAYKEGVVKKETKAKKESAYRSLLKEAGVSEKRIDAIMRVTVMDDIELAEDGTIKDSEAKKESIKKEWADFIGTESVEGARTSTPPPGNGNNGGGKGKSRAAELAERYHNELYGTSKGEDK